MSLYKVGNIVWAKTDKKYWPAIILSEKQVSRISRKEHVWVFWFGDYRISEIKKVNIKDFTELFREHGKKILLATGKLCENGIYEAIKIYGHPETSNWSNEQLFTWALNNFNGSTYRALKYGKKVVNDACCPVEIHSKFCNKIKLRMPEFVLEKLQQMQQIKTNSPLKAIKNEPILTSKFNIDQCCLGCYSKKIVATHPLFEGKICAYCKENFLKTIFVIGTDRAHYACLICGSLGDMLICSLLQCGRSFCYNCIDNLLSEENRIKWMKQNKWFCFFCKEIKDSLIRVRTDWKENLTILFINTQDPIPRLTDKKRKLRVLSVFDGISSGLIALKNINLFIECYYASEIDISAMNITQKHHKEVQYLGNIKDIDDNKLLEICPIDLYIGGSPCNDLSIANPLRKGLYDYSGTGILFFEYYRLLMKLKQLNGRNFFWLFENVSSMNLEFKDTITKFLRVQPKKINSIWTTPQYRERLFWGNCPSLKCHFEMDGPDLQEFLLPGRKAIVNQIKTITTRSNSLLQGVKMEYPIFDENKNPASLKIVEIERIFGFDDNYTQYEDYSDTTRLKLLGKAWSVPVITQLLHFLKYYFYVKEDEL